MHYVILRDDDTCACTPKPFLDRLYRPFLDRGMPVNLAVIPEVRTDVRIPDGTREGFLTAGDSCSGAPLASMASNRGLSDYLRSEKGYHVVQHGCHHDYMEFDNQDRREVARRLDHGTAQLREAGLEPAPAFVAPYDRLSKPALAEVGARFPVLSTGWFEAGRLPAAWWPSYAVKKALNRKHWRAGGSILLSHPGCMLSYHRPYPQMMDNIQRAVASSRLTVLVTHWWEYFRNGVPDDAFIAVLHEVADWLESRDDVRVVSFASVARGEVPLN